MVKSNSYSASDIEVLEGLDPVRRRPGMYIGGTEGPAGLHHLVRELVDNAVDEALNGYADTITVTLHEDVESITVSDNGRGIPVDKHPKYKKPALEIIFTKLHAGGKFSDRNYASAGGLHGVGASVVNALSAKLEAVVWRDGYEWRQCFGQGRTLGKLERGKRSKNHGTQVFFRPDPEIFASTRFIADRIEKMLQEKAFLNKGLAIVFVDETSGTEKRFCYQDGLRAYLKYQLERYQLSSIDDELFSLERANGIKVELAFCWTSATSDKILSFVNGIATAEGGSHEDGFRAGLGKAVRNYLSVHDLTPKGVKLSAEDIREGLVALVSVTVPGSISQLQFQGQTKDRLNNPEVATPVESLARMFENELNSKPNVAQHLVERMFLAARARAAARTASESISRKVGIKHRLNLPGKLADCSATRPSTSELFIVEGDSAGGSTKQGRDRKTQAVLPLRGKVLNAISAPASKLKENKELMDLISVLGCGAGDQFKLDRLRYGKVIILTDADTDGMHIAALLMAFFFKYLRQLIQAGHLYIGLSPLYRVQVGAGSKESHWVFSDEEQTALLKKLGGHRKVTITRFKGLGEMNPKTLWDTTLNPKTRKLLKIHIDDEAEAQATLHSLLGRDSADRYRLIQENAHRLELDL